MTIEQDHSLFDSSYLNTDANLINLQYNFALTSQRFLAILIQPSNTFTNHNLISANEVFQ